MQVCKDVCHPACLSAFWYLWKYVARDAGRYRGRHAGKQIGMDLFILDLFIFISIWMYAFCHHLLKDWIVLEI